MRIGGLRIVDEQGEEGWIVASVAEIRGAHSQGRTRGEARANLIDALRGLLELRRQNRVTSWQRVNVRLWQ